MYRYAVIVGLIQAVLANRLIGTEDDLMSPDMGPVANADRGVGQYAQPDVVNVGSHSVGARERYDIDPSHLEPIRNNKKKKPRRSNMQRIKNHKARHGGSSKQNSVKIVNTRSIQWKSESVAMVDNCHQGLSRPTWNETNCISCKCKSHQVHCHRPKCEKLECDDPIEVEGECCPKCPEKLCETTDGRRFKDGDKWDMDDCTFCHCSKGKIECSVEDCQVPRCKTPIKVPGRCCPICLDASCSATNGTTITAEAVWREGSCTHCYCSGGEKKCDEERCPYINCTGRHTPAGRCCQKCNEGVVDCVVSEWGSWSECAIQECGGGMAKRYRKVAVPQKNGGNFCPHTSEARMCPRLACNVLPVCPVTEWSSWSHCPVTCNVGRIMRTRQRAKATGAPMTSLIDCSQTHFEETKRCELGSCSNVVDMGRREALVHDDICYQVTWSEWSPCSSPNCALGTQNRTQVLLNKFHPRGHLCHLLKEIRICECDSSRQAKQVTRCQVSPWSNWTPCSRTCGPGGTKTRRRHVLQEPSGGAQCPKLSVSRPCKVKACARLLDSIPSAGNVCFTDDGVIKNHGEKWTEGSCATCRCEYSQILCQNTGCEH